MWMIISFPKIMLPLLAGLHNGVHLLIIGRVSLDNIREGFTVIGHNMFLLSEDCTITIVRGFCVNLKWLLQVW